MYIFLNWNFRIRYFEILCNVSSQSDFIDWNSANLIRPYPAKSLFLANFWLFKGLLTEIFIKYPDFSYWSEIILSQAILKCKKYDILNFPICFMALFTENMLFFDQNLHFWQAIELQVDHLMLKLLMKVVYLPNNNILRSSLAVLDQFRFS